MKYLKIAIVIIFFTSCRNKEIKKDIDYGNDNKNEIVNNNIQADSKNIIGVWNWRSDDKSQEFTIKIKKIEKDSVFGQYCAVYNNGSKLDCDVDDINNIKGLIVKDKIQLSFDSFFGAKKGKAEIKIFKNYIEWKVIKSPKGEYYSPKLATLYRKSNKNETAISEKKVELPFDYEKYMDLCYLKENTICDEKFPSYKSDELSSIVLLINSKINKNAPDIIYCIDNLGLDFSTYVFIIRDEVQDYLSTTYLMNVRDNKIIANQLIGQYPDGEAPEDVDIVSKTFIIDKGLIVSVFDKIYKKKNKLSAKYIVNSDGTIQTY
ncbi:hypothetical protein [Flavobacterium hydatis]|uniref:Lipoprotein n=1 Tax=Flavobacterium hydatis TaxID=991 RepID=A0A085ZZA2_FLAHY|nr:hypothetical protein [Flavobacterium hydatis]KFF09766.1 hypothetical protein IW20_22510 [Flavobacterium hydatis]OXA95424.1 hypothetical protein B0A62_08935 [Flavobacterium hydatis]